MKPAQTTSPGDTVRAWIDYLAIADPEAARGLRGRLAGLDPSPVAERISAVVNAVIAALAMESAYGHALAEGAGRLLAAGADAGLTRYLDRVRAAAQKGATLAGLMARHLAPVLVSGDCRLADNVDRAIGIMLAKGTYTLKAPLETLSHLIDTGDMASAHAFTDLLGVVYALDTTYNRTVYLTHTLARAVKGFSPSRRRWQIRGLTRIMATDERLADDYLQGLAGGLHLLSATALDQFLNQAIRRCRQDLERGARFLSLEARRAKEICRDLQVAVPLSAVRSRLERYLLARTGRAVAVRPLSALPRHAAAGDADNPMVFCDGRSIYLPDEMDVLGERTANAGLFNLLVRLEAGTIEFGSHELDAEKVTTIPAADDPAAGTVPADRSDLARFVERFDNPRLALDLFTLFEHARIAHLVRRCYPGLARRLAAAMEAGGPGGGARPIGGTLYPLYHHLVVGTPRATGASLQPAFQAMAGQFRHELSHHADAPETSARMAAAAYAVAAALAGDGPTSAYEPLRPPFGRRFDPASSRPWHQACHHAATDIKNALATRSIRIYRSDLRQMLVRQDGQLSADDLKTLIVNTKDASARPPDNLSWLDLRKLICAYGLGQSTAADDDDGAFRYREWDGCMGDYLPDRVRVREHHVQGMDTGFYQDTLKAHHGLARRIRYAFELLRPEALTILRQWREGDAFDYRALLDYAIDRKAGLMPSDRLFIKRVKRVRDVAVLLLVDLSRSTANAVDDRGTPVLDVEKQAIVLFCEALTVVGDRFAIAGFSGTGPLGVDYYRVKDLETPFDDAVRARIGAMAPQRSTRMGAAIRHATAMLKPVAAQVRLIMILGDGFPNDIEYKGSYAVEDTRRAIMEARADAVHVKAITVNVSDNGLLDRLYGKTHHTLIGNVSDLPDRLVRVYSSLTRH